MAVGGLMPIKAPLFAVFTPQFSAARRGPEREIRPNTQRLFDVASSPVHRERPLAT